MSSDAASKGASSWKWLWIVVLAFTAGVLLGSLFSGGELPKASTTKAYKAGGAVSVLRDSSAPGRRFAQGAAAVVRSTLHPTAVAASEDDNKACDIARIHLGFDVRHKTRSDELRAKLDHRHHIKFEELYSLVVNRPYDPNDNIWNTFPNPYNLKPSFKFPYSNLRKPQIITVIELVARPIELAVEVGSFHGHSAIWQALVLHQRGYKETPLLCIDPWTGALGQLLNRDDWDKKLTPGEIADGRSTSYYQFMLNVRQQINQGNIGPHHIIPLAVTSIVGARFLMALGLAPDMIFLDSAHEVDETFIELALYYEALAPGGVVYGDDFSWEGVKHDVTRFVAKHSLELKTDGVIWMIKKPQQQAR